MCIRDSRQGGALLLRIEDTDRERSRPEYVAALLEDLRWLGLDWQEGPEIGGPHPPYAQSGRTAIYAGYYQRLEAADQAYPCFCTPAELALSRKTQLAAGRPPRYAGTCAKLNACLLYTSAMNSVVMAWGIGQRSRPFRSGCRQSGHPDGRAGWWWRRRRWR